MSDHVFLGSALVAMLSAEAVLLARDIRYCLLPRLNAKASQSSNPAVVLFEKDLHGCMCHITSNQLAGKLCCVCHLSNSG